jgi:hypothetical protein
VTPEQKLWSLTVFNIMLMYKQIRAMARESSWHIGVAEVGNGNGGYLRESLCGGSDTDNHGSSCTSESPVRNLWGPSIENLGSCSSLILAM